MTRTRKIIGQLVVRSNNTKHYRTTTFMINYMTIEYRTSHCMQIIQTGKRWLLVRVHWIYRLSVSIVFDCKDKLSEKINNHVSLIISKLADLFKARIIIGINMSICIYNWNICNSKSIWHRHNWSNPFADSKLWPSAKMTLINWNIIKLILEYPLSINHQTAY